MSPTKQGESFVIVYNGLLGYCVEPKEPLFLQANDQKLQYLHISSWIWLETKQFQKQSADTVSLSALEA